MKNEKMEKFQEIMKTPGVVKILKLQDLNIDRDNYQREVQPYSKKIAKNFDPRACLPLVIFERQDKSLWVIDGQQRRQALLANSYTDWICIVHPSDGPEMEARLFALIGGGSGTVKKLSTKQLFKSELTAKDPTALAVKQGVENAGWVLDYASANIQLGHVCCLTTLKTIIRVYGKDTLTKTLKVISKTWPEDKEATRHVIVGPVSSLFGTYPHLDEERFIRVLGASPVLAIMQDSFKYTGGNSAISGAYAAIVRRWNKKIKLVNRLPEALSLKDAG